jgi:hypothetical protein
MNDSDQTFSVDIFYEFCKLIDLLIKDIQHLESEVVKTRYELSYHLNSYEQECLRSEILSNLAGRYGGTPAYDSYVQLFYNKQDPMESTEWVTHICNLAHISLDSED